MLFRRIFVSRLARTPAAGFAALAFSFALSAAAHAETDFLSSAELRNAGLAKFWQLQLPLEGKTRLANIYLLDDALYAATSDGFVYALDSQTGVIRWLRPVTSGDYPVRRPCHAGSRVVFTTTAELMQVDRLSGEGKMKLNLGFANGADAVSDDISIFLGSENHRFYALSAASGFEQWKAGTNGRITSRPVLWNNVLYVASHDSNIYAAKVENKARLWQKATTGANSADLAADERGIFVASEDHSLYLFDATTGQIVWRARLSGALFEPPVLAPDLAFQYCADDGLCAVDTNPLEVPQRIKWKMFNGRTLLTADKKYAYILTVHGNIVAARLSDGAIDHVIAAPGFRRAAPSVADGAIFVAGEDGRVFCARARSVPFLKREDLRVALAAGPKDVGESAQRRASGDAAAAGKTAGRPAADKNGAAGPATTAPAEKSAPAASLDYLESQTARVLIGGKSKVTRSFEEGGEAAGKSGEAAGEKPGDAGAKPTETDAAKSSDAAEKPDDKPSSTKPADAGGDAAKGDKAANGNGKNGKDKPDGAKEDEKSDEKKESDEKKKDDEKKSDEEKQTDEKKDDGKKSDDKKKSDEEKKPGEEKP